MKRLYLNWLKNQYRKYFFKATCIHAQEGYQQLIAEISAHRWNAEAENDPDDQETKHWNMAIDTIVQIIREKL